MPKDREICCAQRRAGSWALPRFARPCVGVGGSRLPLPVCLRPQVVPEMGQVAASRHHAPSTCLAPGLCLACSSPRKLGLKKVRRSGSLIWTVGDKTKAMESLLAMLLSWHRPPPAGSSEDRGFSSRLRVNPRPCEGRGCRVLQMPDSPNAELLNALISLNIAHPNI